MVWFDDELFEDLRRLRELMHRSFPATTSQVIAHKGHPKKTAMTQWTGFRSPVCDMYETENKVVATFELPGVDKKDIDLNVTDDYVEVKVGRKAESKMERKGYYRYESRCQSFFRRVSLPAGVKAQEARAEFNNGILKVEVPKKKKQEEKKTKIEIK